MNCSEFDVELDQLVESRTGSLTDCAVAHAESCDTCRRRWLDHRLIDAALVAWRPVQSPSTLKESILAELAAEQTWMDGNRPVGSDGIPAKVSRVEARMRWMAVSVAAACLLMVLGLGVATRPGSVDRRLSLRNGGDPVRLTHLPVPTSDAIEVASSMEEVLNDLRTGYQELAAETTATAREFAVTIPAAPVVSWGEAGLPNVGLKAVDPNGPPSGNADAAARGAVTEIGRSIGTQIGQAMDFLWVAVPESLPRG
jgi:hypothetical protein